MSKVRAFAVAVLFGLVAVDVGWLLFFGLGLAHDVAGWVGVVLGILLFPAVPFAAACYAGAVRSDWRAFGGLLLALLCAYCIAKLREGSKREKRRA